MRKIILILIIILFGCESKNSLKISLEKVGEITSEVEGEYQGAYISKVLVQDNEIIFVDEQTCEIFVYDFDSLKFKKKFGSKGMGPGELSNPVSISKKDNRYYVNDMTKVSISVFNNEGKFIKNLQIGFCQSLFNINNEIFATPYLEIPEQKIIKITGLKDTIQIRNLETITNQKDLNIVNFFTDSKNLFFSSFNSSKVISFDSGKAEEVKYELPELKYGKTIFLPFYSIKSGWLRQYFSAKKVENGEKGKSEKKLCFYSKDFALKSSLVIDDESELYNLSLIGTYERYAFFYDGNFGSIKKYRIIL